MNIYKILEFGTYTVRNNDQTRQYAYGYFSFRKLKEKKRKEKEKKLPSISNTKVLAR